MLLNASSAVLTDSAPGVALALNPFNSDALLAAVARGSGPDGKSLEPALRARVATALVVSPANAKIISLAGVLAEQDGDLAEAEKLYDASLAILPTEPVALSRKLAFALERRELATASRHAQILLRRWSKHWAALEPYLPQLFSDPAVFEGFVDSIRDEPHLRTHLVTSLGKDPGNSVLVYNAILRWREQGVDDLRREINAAIGQFFTQKNYALAYRLFRATLDAERNKDADFIVNGDFRLEPNGAPFDWQIRPVTGVNIAIAAGGEPGLRFNFLDSPLALATPRQYLRLAPYRYRIAVSYSAVRLKGPKPLRLAALCGARELTAVEFAAGDVPDATLKAEFAFGADECPVVELRFASEKLPESWRNRYSGRLTVHRVAIEPVSEN